MLPHKLLAKETYFTGKRDLLSLALQVAKETYFIGKRDLLQRQKRPTIMGVSATAPSCINTA